MLMIKSPRNCQQRSAMSTLMVIVSIVLLPLKDSSGSEVNEQLKQDYSNSHAHIQYPSNTQTTLKGKIIYLSFSFLGFFDYCRILWIYFIYFTKFDTCQMSYVDKILISSCHISCSSTFESNRRVLMDIYFWWLRQYYTLRHCIIPYLSLRYYVSLLVCGPKVTSSVYISSSIIITVAIHLVMWKMIA